MPFVAFLGCDGSGKSAVIHGVARQLRSRGIRVTCGHWRPVAFGGGDRSGHLATAPDPHGQVPRGLAGSVAKLGWLWLNWWCGWFRWLRRARRSGVVLFDRYHADLLVDPRRYRYGGPRRLARLASRLMPQPDLVVFLDAPPEVLLQRKQEVSRDALERSRERYLSLCTGHPRFRIIDASRPLADVVAAACAAIDHPVGRIDSLAARG